MKTMAEVNHGLWSEGYIPITGFNGESLRLIVWREMIKQNGRPHGKAHILLAILWHGGRGTGQPSTVSTE